MSMHNSPCYARLTYLAPSVESSLYRNGKVFTHRDRDGNDDASHGVVTEPRDVVINDARRGDRSRRELEVHGFELLHRSLQRPDLQCVSAWNKDPVFGVIGIQSGPRDEGPQWLPSNHGSRGWDAGGGDDCEDPSRLFCSWSADQGDLPRAWRIAQSSPQPRPAPTTRALPAKHADQRGPFWMPIRGPIPTPIDTDAVAKLRACLI